MVVSLYEEVPAQSIARINMGAGPRVSLGYLRDTIPSWDWMATKDGFGYVYSGSKGARSVEVRSYSVQSGFLSDDYSTVWRVIEGDDSCDLDMFWMVEESCG